MRTIGVFDSGVGGLSVANAIQKAMPDDRVIFVNDEQHVPYGTKSPDELLELAVPILKNLVELGAQVIVVACNTLSTTVIKELRAKIPLPLIAMEPMVKPACQQTKTGTVAVCATPATLASKRYSWLKETYAKDVEVLEPDCSDWSFMIQSKQIDRQKIHDLIDLQCQKGADVIVLGCTHYHWIEDIVNATANGRAKVIQPEQPVIKQLQRVLKES